MAALPGIALANELWVAPAKKEAGKEVGNWAVTSKGETHFSFAVPDDLDSFVAAAVVVIGKKDTDISYDVDLSISQNARRHDDHTDSLQDVPVTVFEDELLEIDVSAVIPGGLFAGTDYISLAFETESKGDVRVIGLRFRYEDPEGPAGPPGPRGPEGPTGPLGPSNTTGTVTNITVNCPAESISDALANAGGALVITVTGTCRRT